MTIPPAAYRTVVDAFESDHRGLDNASTELEISDPAMSVTLWGVPADVRSRLVEAAVPAWLSERCPTAKRLWVASRPEPAETEISYGCPRCQTALSLTADSARVNDCPRCRARVFTPESLWTLLHGPVRMWTWIVELHGENRFDRAERLRLERERRERDAAEAAQRRKAEREAATRARTQAALDRDLTRLRRTAKVLTSVHALVVVAAIVAPWIARITDAGWMPGAIFGAYLATLATGAIGLGAGAAIMQRATGDRDLTFPVWFNFVFVAVMPGVGHLLGFEAIFGLRRGRNAERYGRHADYAALNWAIITLGGLALIASILLACLL